MALSIRSNRELPPYSFAAFKASAKCYFANTKSSSKWNN